MLDLVFIALMQAVSGDPAPAADPVAQPPAVAQQPGNQGAAQGAEAPDPDHVMRCQRERLSGSRLTQRICTTPAQDREMEEYARTEVQRGQSQLTTRD